MIPIDLHIPPNSLYGRVQETRLIYHDQQLLLNYLDCLLTRNRGQYSPRAVPGCLESRMHAEPCITYMRPIKRPGGVTVSI